MPYGLTDRLWKLKDKGIAHEVTWSILATASGYNTTTKQCRLCLTECWFILFKEELATLNRRQEIFSSCRHRARLTLNPREAVEDWNFHFHGNNPICTILRHSCFMLDESNTLKLKVAINKHQKAFSFYSNMCIVVEMTLNRAEWQSAVRPAWECQFWTNYKRT